MNLSIRAVALLLLIVGLASSGCQPETPTGEARPAARYAIGISPFLDKDSKDEAFRSIVGFLIEGAPTGSTIHLYDAFHNASIASVAIPDTRAAASPKARATQLKQAIGQLKRFLASDAPRLERAGWDFGQAIRLPQFLDFLADNLPRDERPAKVLLIGRPLYLDEREPSFSMVGGRFPSDGHLRAPR